jgi:excisionase family DNA binding protein
MSVREEQLAARWVGRAEACRYLGIGRETLRCRMRERRIAYRRDGSRVLFDLAELDRYAAGQVVEARR